MVRNIEITVSGLVQGVYFRASTQRRAEELGLRGEVKNLPDGRVWISAEGEGVLLDMLVEWCHLGPAQAEVEKVEVQEGQVKGYRGFAITR